MRLFSIRYYGNLYRYKPVKFAGVCAFWICISGHLLQYPCVSGLSICLIVDVDRISNFIQCLKCFFFSLNLTDNKQHVFFKEFTAIFYSILILKSKTLNPKMSFYYLKPNINHYRTFNDRKIGIRVNRFKEN